MSIIDLALFCTTLSLSVSDFSVNSLPLSSDHAPICITLSSNLIRENAAIDHPPDINILTTPPKFNIQKAKAEHWAAYCDYLGFILESEWVPSLPSISPAPSSDRADLQFISDDLTDRLTAAILDAANTCLPASQSRNSATPTKKVNSWWKDSTVNLRKLRADKLASWKRACRHPSEESHARYATARNKWNAAARAAKNNSWERFCESIDEDNSREAPRKFWSQFKRSMGSRGQQSSGHGNAVKHPMTNLPPRSKEEAIENMACHFENVSRAHDPARFCAINNYIIQQFMDKQLHEDSNNRCTLDCKIQTLVTRYDLRIGRRVFLPRWCRTLVPSRWGWFMVIRGAKP
jgi:hypothetical protein